MYSSSLIILAVSHMYPFASIQSINIYTEGSITTEELEIGLWNAIIQSKETRVPRLIRLVDACVCNEIDGLSEPVMNAILSVLDDTITSQELMNLGEYEGCRTHCCGSVASMPILRR